MYEYLIALSEFNYYLFYLNVCIKIGYLLSDLFMAPNVL